MSRHFGPADLGRWFCVFAWCGCLTFAAGCTSRQMLPTATVGDPSVFTTLHVVAADQAYKADAAKLGDDIGAKVGFSPLGHLNRYFGSTPADYKKVGRRMDQFLDQTQRSQAFSLAVAQRLGIEVKANAIGPVDTNFSSSAPADASTATSGTSTGATTKSLADADKAASAQDAATAKVVAAKAALAKAQTAQVDAKAKLDAGKTDAETAATKVREVDESVRAKTAAVEDKKRQLELVKTKLSATQPVGRQEDRFDAEVAVNDAQRELDNKKNELATRQSDKAVQDEKGKAFDTEATTAKNAVDTANQELTTAQADLGKQSVEQAKTDDQTAVLAALAQLAEPNDSPFDRLDRANDWFTAYMTLILSNYGGDSRALDTEWIKQVEHDAYQWAKDQSTREAASYATVALQGLNWLANAGGSEKLLKVWLKQLNDVDSKADKLEITWPEQKSATPPSTKNALSQSRVEEFSTERIGAKLKELPRFDSASSLTTLITGTDPSKDFVAVLDAVAQAISAVAVHAQRRDTLDALAKVTYPKPATGGDGASYRLITLLVPVAIDAGTRPNTLVGNTFAVKAIKQFKLDENDKPSKDAGKEYEEKYAFGAVDKYVRVLTLHPRRNYDLEDQRLSQSLRDTRRVAAEVGYTDIAGKVDASNDKKQEEASRFLSRVSKVGAWQDATSNSFGWTFAPSSVRVVPRSLGGRLLSLAFGQPGREYRAVGDLETGVRLCSVVMLVRDDVKAIEFEVSDYVADVEHGAVGLHGKRSRGLRNPPTKSADECVKAPAKKAIHKLRVELPTYDSLERTILTLPQLPAPDSGTASKP